MSLIALSLFACGGLDAFERSRPAQYQQDLLGRERDPVGAILDRAAGLDDALRADKFCRMSEGAFPFYRATAHLFYEDMHHEPLREQFAGPVTWLSGDAHPHNFGTFDDDEGRVVFDLNDFDEAFVGDAQLDLWRLATGADLLADEVGLDQRDRQRVIQALAEGWLDALNDHARGNSERDFQMTEGQAWGRLDNFLDDVKHDNSRRRMLRSWTDDGVFDADKGGLEEASSDEVADLLAAWPSYLAQLDTALAGDDDWFEVKDVKRRVGAGLGSLGTPRFAVLIEGPSNDDDDDRILDVKQQGEPAAWPFLDEGSRAISGSEPGSRVVIAHTALLSEADDHLGWFRSNDSSWSVRERSPYKETLPNSEMDSATRFRKIAEQWGYVLGTAHARADEDSNAGVFLDFDRSMVDVIGDDEDAFIELTIEIGQGYAMVVRSDQDSFARRVGCSE